VRGRSGLRGVVRRNTRSLAKTPWLRFRADYLKRGIVQRKYDKTRPFSLPDPACLCGDMRPDLAVLPGAECRRLNERRTDKTRGR
jgi:hypothetical protein